MTKVQVIGQRINPEEERWVVCETAEKPNMQEHIPGKFPWKLQTKLPEMIVEHFQTVAMLADFFANRFQGILFKVYRDIMFNSVSQYPKDHQDPRSVLKNLEIKAYKVFMAKSGDKGEVTNRQSVDSKKIPLPLEPNGKPKCQVGGKL